jgi:hypothetical protein
VSRKRLIDMALEQGKFFPPFHTKSGKGIEMGTRTDMGGTDSLAEHAYRIVAVEREAAFVCRFIDTTNAGEYAADQYDRGLRSWRDMPPIVPPWINFWMEAPVDLQTMDDTFTTVIRKTSSRYAVLWSALTRAILGEAWNEPPDVVVCLEGMLFLEIDGKACGPIGVWKIGLDDRGIAVNEEFKSMFAHLDEQDGTPVNERREEEFRKMAMASGWALAFMSCANVDLEPVPRGPAKVEAKYKRRHGRFPTRFSTLRITKIGGGGKGSGSGEVVQHIVRGHMVHYGDCCPGQHAPKGLLFGKITGRFIVPMHARGNPEHGEVTSRAVKLVDPAHHPNMEAG